RRYSHSSIFSLCLTHAPYSTLFPYTTLFRSHDRVGAELACPRELLVARRCHQRVRAERLRDRQARGGDAAADAPEQDPFALREADRKSTRLNSSHEWISYAVFCLKKKRNREA